MTANHTEATLGALVSLLYELDRNGVATDPARLNLLVRAADGTTVAVDEWTGVDGDIEKVATGRFYTEVLPTKTGPWVWRWSAFDGSDAQIGAAEGQFIVHTLLR